MRRFALGVCAVGALALAPSPAGAAVTIGETFAPPLEGYQCQNQTWIQELWPASPAAQYGVPSAGVITSWSFEAGANPPTLMRFKAFRSAPPAPFEFLVVGRSDAEVPAANETSSFATRIPVQAGDLIGFYVEGATLPCMRLQSGFTLELQYGDILAGETSNYVPGDNSLQLDVAAQLEPDADNDGFGDETQDQCPSDSGIQTVACRDTTLPDTTPPDTTAPETTIIEQPKRKSTKRKATFTFSSEAGATFKCSLDGEPFNVCTSPLSFTAKPGRHSFVVFAKDAADNVDDTPATASWMVKKKKKKK